MQKKTNEELAKFIDSSTPDELKSYFNEHNVNDRIEVVLDEDTTFYGTALSYAVYSGNTTADHIQALIESDADLTFEIPLFWRPIDRTTVMHIDEDGSDSRSYSFNMLRDASSDKQTLIISAHEQWLSRERRDNEVVDMLRNSDPSIATAYFATHDPNAEITVEYANQDLRFRGPVVGFAGFDAGVSAQHFNVLLQAGGDPNGICRIEKISDTLQFNMSHVIEKLSSCPKISYALDAGGTATEHTVDAVVFGLNGINLEGLRELEDRLVKESPELFQGYHMHDMYSTNAVIELLMMGKDSTALNGDGQSLMVSAIVKGDFQRADALKSFGLSVNGSEGQNPMDHVVQQHIDAQNLLVSSSRIVSAEQRVLRSIDYVVEHAEDPSAVLGSYMKMGNSASVATVERLLERGAVPSVEMQNAFQADRCIMGSKKESIQQAFNRHQGAVIQQAIGENIAAPTMSRRM